MKKIIYFIYASIFLLPGCVITKVHTMPVEKYNASYDLVWNSVITYLDKEKEPVIAKDKEKGIISTDWVNLQKVFSVKRYRYDIRITKIETGGIQLGIASPQQAYSMGDWEDALPNERRARRIFKAVRKDVEKASGKHKVSKRTFNRRPRGLRRNEV